MGAVLSIRLGPWSLWLSDITYDGDLSGADTAGAFYDGNGGGASLQFTSTHLTIRPAAAPEPASWAMMLGGFGLVGGMMRRRRKGAVSFGHSLPTRREW